MQPTESPALKRQSSGYPLKYNGRVPKRIRMNETVQSEVFVFTRSKEDAELIAIRGREYDAWVNSHGAVAAICDNGKLLGVKPLEFEVVEWHETELIS